ncbi:MAG TPA: extracellular solute-binding protein [Acetobacteraceae bacterium]|nr:extracellular solute-binding protein [Acetobacteraceae bacterium]
MDHALSRRAVLGAAAAAALARRAASQPAKPKQPLAVTVVDVAGNLALTQKAFEAYRRAKPDMVSRFNFTKAPAPELPAKIRAQQNANRVDLDLVLTGTDALSAGIEQKLWVELIPARAGSLPNLEQILLEPAWRMQSLAQGQGVVISYYPSGALLEYMPDKVKTAPGSAEELLAWTKANPNRFIYARPANSGPGRTFMMGLPYILGDSDPKDPMKGWDKTWAYLKELDKNIEYYPTGTGAVMKELGEGSRDMIVSTTGWDINPRVLGIVPKEAKIATLKGFHWVTDAHYAAIPRGLDEERMGVLLDVIAFILQPQQQAFTYDEGYFYPGPAVKDVPLSMAPKESQDAIREYGRPEYEKLIADAPKELPLEPNLMVQAFRRWDEEIGGKKTK